MTNNYYAFCSMFSCFTHRITLLCPVKQKALAMKQEVHSSAFFYRVMMNFCCRFVYYYRRNDSCGVYTPQHTPWGQPRWFIRRMILLLLPQLWVTTVWIHTPMKYRIIITIRCVALIVRAPIRYAVRPSSNSLHDLFHRTIHSDIS